MKKVISIIILIVGLSTITIFTSYVLTHKGIPIIQEKKNVKKIEQVSVALNNNVYSYLYNLNFSGSRHKFKLDYKITSKEEKNYLELSIYLDGKNIFTDFLCLLSDNATNEYFNSNSFAEYSFNEKNVLYIKSQSKEYLVLSITYQNEKYYYIFDKDGKPMLDSGILYNQKDIVYSSDDKNFKFDNGNLAKIDRDVIYSYVPILNKDSYQIEEYQYNFINDNLEKKLIQTYVDVTGEKSKEMW